MAPRVVYNGIVTMDPSSLPNERLGESRSAAAPLMPAILAGLGASLIGGVVWTAIIALTGYEIGFAAWALGGFVGFAMSRTTSRRDPAAGAAAAALALTGLLIARVLIGEFVLFGSGVGELLQDQDLMTQAAAIEMQMTEELPPELQARYEALADSDTVPDALWEDVLVAAVNRLEGASEEDRIRMAEQFAGLVFGQLTLTDRVTAQFGAFDLLWAFLAVSTAWGMMSKPKEEEELRAESV